MFSQGLIRGPMRVSFPLLCRFTFARRFELRYNWPETAEEDVPLAAKVGGSHLVGMDIKASTTV